MHEHSAGLAVLLAVPVVVVGLLVALDLAARRGIAAAVTVAGRFEAAPPALKLAALLMAASAGVHLGLVPAHLAEEPLTAGLFAVDALALAAAAAAAVLLFDRPAARAAAAALVAAGVIAYAGYLAAGLETADALGVGTKLLELAALALLVHPSFIRRSFPA